VDDPLVLDTHAWIWLEEGLESEFTAAVRSLMAEARSRGALSVSAISVYEIELLVTKDRLHLKRPLREVLTEAAAPSAVRVLPVTATIAMDAASLPGEFHRDPADQMIVSTAREYGATLLTRDHNILKYAQQGHVRVLHV
jgi:PIN domain nuclease of toxin-antitoxin system